MKNFYNLNDIEDINQSIDEILDIKNNIGKQLIIHLEKIASKKKVKSIFLLTTKSKSWFLNLGYKISNIANLPSTKIKLYNKKRNSVVLLKKL